jgi:spore maturation protein CgeB
MESGNYMGDQRGEASVYRGAKIGINCSHFDYERYSSDRLYRMLGCGICVLSHDYKGITKDFIPEKDLIVWEDFDDLRVKIDRCLDEPVGRQTVAAAGLEVGKKFFTFDVMAENIRAIYMKGISGE